MQETASRKQQSHWQGSLNLVYTRQGEATQVSYAYAVAPLKIQRPFYPEGDAVCHSALLHTAGGVVGGDRLSLSLHLQPQTAVVLTTAASSKLYRSAGDQADQTMQATLASGSVLEWLPQPTIVFDGALYCQHTQIHLASKAIWLGWDIVRFGRSARGEQFHQGYWRSVTEVWQEGQPLWIDRQQLVGGSPLLTCSNGLGERSVIGTLALLGYPLDVECMAQVRSLPQPTSPNSETGATRLQSGLLCRYRGNSSIEAHQWFTAIWNLLRPRYLHRPACCPRVWQQATRIL